jgi:hypothetical protein
MEGRDSVYTGSTDLLCPHSLLACRLLGLVSFLFLLVRVRV